MWDVPSGWSTQQATTVPLAYVTAYYALMVRGNIKSKATVLIHSATSCVGQACVQVARHQRCSILATTNSIQEKAILERDLGIHPDHVINMQFYSEEIMKLTQGRGETYFGFELQDYEQNYILLVFLSYCKGYAWS